MISIDGLQLLLPFLYFITGIIKIDVSSRCLYVFSLIFCLHDSLLPLQYIINCLSDIIVAR